MPLCGNAIGLKEKAPPVGKPFFSIAGNGVFLRVEKQDVFAQGAVIFLLRSRFQFAALMGGAPEHFTIPVKQDKICIWFPFFNALPKVVIRLGDPAQALGTAIPKECTEPQVVLPHTCLIQPHIDFREFQPAFLDIKPDIGILPIINRVKLTGIPAGVRYRMQPCHRLRRP